MKIKLLLPLFFLPFLIFSQERLEAGFFAGIANYQGDLVENDIQLGETKIALGGILRYHLSTKFNIRGSAYFGSIAGDDKNSEELAARMFRFKSDVLELGLMGEWKIMGRERYNSVGVFMPHFTPYLLGGIAYTHAPNETECYDPACQGADNPFPEAGDKTAFISFPIGAGLKYDIFEFFTIGGEFGFRALFSDYLDGVSENGRSDKNDWYFFSGLTATFFFGNGPKGLQLD